MTLACAERIVLVDQAPELQQVPVTPEIPKTSNLVTTEFVAAAR